MPDLYAEVLLFLLYINLIYILHYSFVVCIVSLQNNLKGDSQEEISKYSPPVGV